MDPADTQTECDPAVPPAPPDRAEQTRQRLLRSREIIRKSLDALQRARRRLTRPLADLPEDQ